jgi:hypothetical protein
MGIQYLEMLSSNGNTELENILRILRFAMAKLTSSNDMIREAFLSCLIFNIHMFVESYLSCSSYRSIKEWLHTVGAQHFLSRTRLSTSTLLMLR